METGERIRGLRKNAKLTQAQLGALVDCSESAISCYELGKREPDFESLLKIAESLGTSVQYILTGESGGLLDPDAEESVLEEAAPALNKKISPAKQKLIDSLDGMTDEQIQRLLVVIETAKAIL